MKRQKPPLLSPEDQALFRDAMADVRRLELTVPELQRPAPAPIPRQSLQDARRVLEESISPHSVVLEDIETGDDLVYRRRDIPANTLRKLRRGQFAIQAQLDLHGMTTVAAADALGQFINDCLALGLRAVRIIHGKGHGSPQRRPVLKGKVGLWLQRREDVLAYCSAPPQDGGTGVLYVLLRAQKNQHQK
ncbi:MAG: Smr/MutS family protein [Gammaproteobacteria bacterium]|nr:Smr/MutS family protein [Gammaproteobacteria bacterium]